MGVKLNPIRVGTKELLPLIEGGKGVAVSNGVSAGNWAKCGGIGTFSGANPDYFDENGNRVSYHYQGRTRGLRHEELIEQSINGCVAQARIAKEIAPKSFVNMNVLWEMGGCKQVLEGALSEAEGLIDGITCGAGMPYELAKICADHEVYYFPIVSSMRAFNVLWLRSYKNFAEYLGGVVYEDPWIAGGHNGLSSAEDPKAPQRPYERVVAIRKCMNEYGLQHVPIIIAGGVWWLDEWTDFMDNPEIGAVGFQFGTRPLLTQESPISDMWKKRLLTLKNGDVLLNDFSPTGFYSSAVYNPFLKKLDDRSKRQIAYSDVKDDQFTEVLTYGPRKRELFVRSEDFADAQNWIGAGFSELMKTPSNTIVFETEAEAKQIVQDQIDCMGCLSVCRFSNWDQDKETTGQKPDPRSFCIQKTLQDISHGGSIDDNLMFAGASVFRFGEDPFYENGFVPSVSQLVDRIKSGR